MLRFNPKQVKKILNLFKKSVADLGKELYENEQVYDIYLYPKLDKVEAIVEEVLYEIGDGVIASIYFDGYHKVKKMSCECGKGSYCEHVYAALLSLDETRMYDSEEKEDYGSEEYYPDEEQIESENLPKIKFTQIPGKFVKLPCEKKEDLSKIFEALKPMHASLYNHYEGLDIEMTSENIFIVHIPSPYNYNPEPDLKQEIKIENDDLYVKCDSCHKKINTLCSHNYIALNALSQLSPFYGFWDKRYSFGSMFDDFAKERNLNLTVAKDSFRVFITEDGISYYKTNEDLLLESDIAILQKELNPFIHSGQITEENVFGSRKDLESLGNAILWIYHGRFYDKYVPDLISAKFNKARIVG